jgi:hypothetical protein
LTIISHVSRGGASNEDYRIIESFINDCYTTTTIRHIEHWRSNLAEIKTEKTSITSERIGIPI